MAQPKLLRIYLEPDALKRARDGDFPVMTRIKSAFELHGFRVEFRRNSPEERLKSATRRGWSLFHMEEPFHGRALNLRRAYYYPYWRIEKTNERWDFRVARKPFDPTVEDAASAVDWAANWRKWLFKGRAAMPERRGMVYVPLQGRLLEHRSFQTTAPIAMVREVLARAGDRQVLLGLHPGESYDRTELQALEDLAAGDGRVTITSGGMEDALATCDYVVTENSSAALAGYFFGKPAILYGRIDFHHIALNVDALGVDEAFARVDGHAPDYDTYLYWFIHRNAFKADATDAEAQIAANVRALGGPLE